jgi:hypothetical protein
MLLRASKCILRRTLTDINKTENREQQYRCKERKGLTNSDGSSEVQTEGYSPSFCHESEIEHPSG